MGVSRSPAQLAEKLGALAREFDQLDERNVREGAQLTKDTALAGAPSRLRGVGKRGARLNVRYTLTTTASNPAALVFAIGPWQLIERDTRPHRIPRQRGTRARRRYAVVPAAYNTHGLNDGGARDHVMHPGTKGKHLWAKAMDVARPQVSRLLARGAETAIGRVF